MTAHKTRGIDPDRKGELHAVLLEARKQLLRTVAPAVASSARRTPNECAPGHPPYDRPPSTRSPKLSSRREGGEALTLLDSAQPVRGAGA